MKQIALLARTFFVKLFESELMPAGLPQVQLIIWSVVLIATPTLTLPGVYAQKYTGLWARPGTLSAAINTDRMVLITFAMIALGFVALVIWESVFPDRRDARILGHCRFRRRRSWPPGRSRSRRCSRCSSRRSVQSRPCCSDV